MRHLRLFTACLALSGLALAQETGKEAPTPKQEPEQPQIELPQLAGPSGDQEEMIRLFHEVELALHSIDLELYDAGAGRIPVPEGKESGIERLLRSHGEKSDQAVSGMERILELAQKMGGQSSSQCMKGAMQPKSGEGKSPLDQERKTGPTEGENTPQAPKPQEKEGGPKPEGQKPQGEKPEDRGKNPPPGENRPANPRSDPNGPPVSPGDDADRWGVLPERVHQVFQNQITDDLPLQYRDWIDAYYRRLNAGGR